VADIETNRHITDEEFQTSQEMQIRAVADAIKYFKEPKILVTNYKNRYIYMLQKIHKDLNEWRNQLYHPKMRPIISDVNSITSNLTSFLLPTLQNPINNLLISTSCTHSTCQRNYHQTQQKPTSVYNRRGIPLY
jgi:hypothetical protein